MTARLSGFGYIIVFPPFIAGWLLFLLVSWLLLVEAQAVDIVQLKTQLSSAVVLFVHPFLEG
jgi:hypothetical protein